MAIYVTSDLHGYPFDRFISFLNSTGFGFDDTLYILGDVVDRGDDGLKYLSWLLVQSNVRLILGNHEDMLLNCSFALKSIICNSLNHLTYEQREKVMHWYMNGCAPTVNAIAKLMDTNPDRLYDILDYLASAPLYVPVAVNERNFLLVHGGLGDFRADKPLSEYTAFDFLWSRPTLSHRYFEDITTIVGHTPTQVFGPEYANRMLVTDTWIDIDTGAAYGGHPMLLRLDDMKEFYMQ